MLFTHYWNLDWARKELVPEFTVTKHERYGGLLTIV